MSERNADEEGSFLRLWAATESGLEMNNRTQ